jgi:hypothetical protein
VNSNYLEDCKADNPQPPSADETKPHITLSNCRFLTKPEDLRWGSPFEMAVDATKSGEPKTRRAYFTLWAIREIGGKEERAKSWSDEQEGFPRDDKTVPMVVSATRTLDLPSGWTKSDVLRLELEARHADAASTKSSGPVTLPKSVFDPSKPTHLVLSVFTDGTMNDMEMNVKDGSESNVAKLYTLIHQGTESGILHAAKYVVGIGGGHRVDEGSNWASRKIQGMGNSTAQGIEGFSGLGFSDRIDQAMAWIFELAGQNPDAQVAVQLFGFSRGAAEAIHLVNVLNDREARGRYGLADSKIRVKFVGLFDPVGSLGLPGNDVNPGARLELRGDMADMVVSLVAQSEVRSLFDLISIRIPPSASRGPYSWAPSEWLTKGKGFAFPNPKWEEWVMPGVHSDVGGGYGPEEWIPDVCFQYDTSNPSALRVPGPSQQSWIPDLNPGESLEDYVYRMKDREMDFGAASRGTTSNGFWSRSEIEERIAAIYELKLARWRDECGEECSENRAMLMDKFFGGHPFLPKIRSRDNSLGRIALWVMIEKGRKAGVKWKRLQDLDDEAVVGIQQLPSSHALYYLHNFAADPIKIEQQLWIDNPKFRNVITPRIHDSRLATDLPQRFREVYFCGKKS